MLFIILKEITYVFVDFWQILLSDLLPLTSLLRCLIINVFIVAYVFFFFFDILRFCLLVMQEKIFETTSIFQDYFLKLKIWKLSSSKLISLN